MTTMILMTPYVAFVLGVAMMMGRQSIAKWAFAGAMISGLSFAIVRTMWSNMGLEAAGVGSFSP